MLSFQLRIRAMFREQLISQGVNDERVMLAFDRIDRSRFIPFSYRYRTEEDAPVPIGFDQTISQPSLVAIMTEALQLKESDRVLEIGTGSGFQTAILAEIAAEVYSIERIPELAERSRALLDELNYKNIFTQSGDGYLGWPERAPFDKIILTAAPPEIPESLIDQLKVGGLLVSPEGVDQQQLYRLEKTENDLKKQYLFDVRFVPLVPS